MRRRRSPLVRLLAGVLVGATVTTAAWAATPMSDDIQAREGAPNILIFVIDDQRADSTLGVMPSVRRWFKERGTRFTNAYVTTPLCCPSRATIMTGMYAHNHGLHKNNEGDQLPHEATIQFALSRGGYHTALVGKFLNGWDIENAPPYFERWAMQKYGYNNSLFNVDGVMQRIVEYSTVFVTEKSVEYLREFEAEDPVPWFLYFSPFAAHKPYEAEERYADVPVGSWKGNPAVREHNTRDKPKFEERDISKHEGRKIRRGQLRTLLSVDDAVGRLMRWLKENGELTNTLAFFISDNGRSWGEHGIGGKRTPYTESVKVPLFMRWSGSVPAGTVDKRLVTNLDLAPTILQAAGVTADHRLDGMSLWGDRGRKRLFFEHWGRYGHGIPNWASIRTRRYQYVEYYGRRGARIFREYYNLRKDPWQLANPFGDKSRRDDPRTEDLSKQIRRYRHCAGRECP